MENKAKKCVKGFDSELTVRLCLDGEEISYSQDSFQID